MLFRGAGDTALSVAPARILAHQRSLVLVPRDLNPRWRNEMWEWPWRRDLWDTKVPPTLAQAPLQLLRLNVLVHTEEIIGIVLLFDRHQSLVIAAVGFLDAFLSFVAHQEVYVGAARGIRMHSIIKIFRPRNNFLVVRGIRINPDNHMRP